MKKYKCNYIFTFVFRIYIYLLTLFPGLFILRIFADGAECTVHILRMYIFLLLFAIAVGIVIHFLISLFTEHKVYIGEETITLEGKKILPESMKKEDVGLIVFDLGMFQRYGRNIPGSLTLINRDDTESLNINHPSFFMISEIKKQCKNAKFKFHNWEWYIIWCIIFTVFCPFCVSSFQ